MQRYERMGTQSWGSLIQDVLAATEEHKSIAVEIDPEGVNVGHQHPHSKTRLESADEVGVCDVMLGQVPPAVQQCISILLASAYDALGPFVWVSVVC